MRNVKVFSSSSHKSLSEQIALRLGFGELSPCSITKFSNGETNVKINCSVRNEEVFIIQCGATKVNDSLMELLIMAAACKGGSATKVTAIMPFFPYSKQSKMKKYRTSITAKMVANLLQISGVDHVITFDLRSPQMQGFFRFPIDNILAEPLLVSWVKQNMPDRQNCVVIAKNPAGVKRAISFADALNVSFGISHTDKHHSHAMTKCYSSHFKSDSEQESDHEMNINAITTSKIVGGHVYTAEKQRSKSFVASHSLFDSNSAGTPFGLSGAIDEELTDAEDAVFTKVDRMMTLVGNVKGKQVIILDDLIDQPAQYIAAAEHLVKIAGASHVYIIATHAAFLDDCLQVLENSEFIHRIIVTNSVAIDTAKMTSKLILIDIAPLLASAIRRHKYGEATSDLF